MTRRTLLVLTTAAGLTLALATPAGAVTGSWTIMPAQPAANGFDLHAVDAATASALGSTNVWAVGRIGADSLVERWTGSWSQVAVPAPNPATPAAVDYLTGVVAVAAGDAGGDDSGFGFVMTHP